MKTKLTIGLLTAGMAAMLSLTGCYTQIAFEADDYGESDYTTPAAYTGTTGIDTYSPGFYPPVLVPAPVLTLPPASTTRPVATTPTQPHRDSGNIRTVTTSTTTTTTRSSGDTGRGTTSTNTTNAIRSSGNTRGR